jgi:subtilisin family serine protease
MSYLLQIDNHGTHVAGTLAGDGTLSGGLWRGMATQALLHSWFFGGTVLTNMLSSIMTEFTVILQNSWGVLTNNWNPPSCTYLGDYHWLSAGVDQLARDHSVAFYFSQGNSRAFDCLPLTYGTTAVPASAKNVVAVGAVDKTSPGAMTAFSGWGPTDDGRLKPDVVAVGFTVLDLGNPGPDISSATARSMRCAPRTVIDERFINDDINPAQRKR